MLHRQDMGLIKLALITIESCVVHVKDSFEIELFLYKIYANKLLLISIPERFGLNLRSTRSQSSSANLVLYY